MTWLLPFALLSSPAQAGTCTVTVHETKETTTFAVDKAHTHDFQVGRWPVRFAVTQSKTERGHWLFDMRIERRKDDAWEVLVAPKVVTGVGMDAHLDTESKLGHVAIHCRD